MLFRTLIFFLQWYDANDFDRFYRSFLSKCNACEGFRRYFIFYFCNASDIFILCSSSLRAYLIHHSWNLFCALIKFVLLSENIVLHNVGYESKVKGFLLNKIFHKLIISASQISQITKFFLIFPILFFAFMREFVLNLISLIVDLFVEIGHPLALAFNSWSHGVSL